ncbi:MAG: PQQ-dependent sugar dehydrogenase [Gemmatimonadota bacterium]
MSRAGPRAWMPPAVALLAVPWVVGCGEASPQGTTGGGGPPPPGPAPTLRLTAIATGLSSPVDLQSPPGDPRLFIVEQSGRILILEGDSVRSTPFLDLTGRVVTGSERGLLGLAFHPAYAANGFFYVNFTGAGGETRVERFTAGPDPSAADPSSAKLILRVAQPFGNHNGGQVVFGPDGMLYVALGDGGSGGDPLGNGQNRQTLLGSILRIDVDGGDPYAIPPDNPFVSDPAARDEIWAYGLRNPWRSAFDPADGLLYIADVGQNRLEEIDVIPAGTGGRNLGWNVMEAGECFGSSSCDRTGLTLPALQYDHGEGCSIIGGRVYRGRSIPAIVGHYFYSDFCAGWLRSFRFTGGTVTQAREWSLPAVSDPAAFGEDRDGELYVLSLGGTVFRLDSAP